MDLKMLLQVMQLLLLRYMRDEGLSIKNYHRYARKQV